jgi:succinate-semialdehyde dehydrogenase
VRYAGERIPVARLLVNQPTPDAWGPATNSLSPAVSEGCGTWGNNILADNVDYIHMLNVSKIVMPLDVELPDGEKIFAD